MPVVPGLRERFEALPDACAVGMLMHARVQLFALLRGGERRLFDGPPANDSAPESVDHGRAGNPTAVTRAECQRAL